MLELSPSDAVLVLCTIIAVLFAVKVRRRGSPSGRAVYGMLVLNILGLVLLAILSLSLVSRVLAQEAAAPALQAVSTEVGMGLLAAGLATGLAVIGAGIAVGMTGSAAIGAVAEKPELLGRSLVFVGLAEGIAIYGLIVSILILGKI